MAQAAARRDAPRWEAAADEHRVALASYLDTAEHLAGDAWTRPRAPGAWSPAEVTEHLALTYRALLQEIEGGAGLALRLPGWRRTLLRWFLLPHILFHRSFPLRAPSPRELRPAAPGALPDRDEALAALRALGERFEEAADRCRDQPGRHVTHPYFGAIPLCQGVRFAAVHLEHHRRQLEA